MRGIRVPIAKVGRAGVIRGVALRDGLSARPRHGRGRYLTPNGVRRRPGRLRAFGVLPRWLCLELCTERAAHRRREVEHHGQRTGRGRPLPHPARGVPADRPSEVQRHRHRRVAERQCRRRLAERLDHGPQRAGPEWCGVGRRVGTGGRRQRAQGRPTRTRYGSLVHPGDRYSYDMFSQVGRNVRQTPRWCSAVSSRSGCSRPASRSRRAARHVHRRGASDDHVYDGFLVHSRGSGGAPLSQSPLPTVSVPSPLQIRDDLDVPVFVVQAEGDVIGSVSAPANPIHPCSARGSWPVPPCRRLHGQRRVQRHGNGNGAVRCSPTCGTRSTLGCAKPINAGPHHWILQAAFHHLDTWVQTGIAPPAGPAARCRLDVADGARARLPRKRARWCAVAACRRAGRDPRRRQHRRRLLPALRQHDPADARNSSLRCTRRTTTSSRSGTRRSPVRSRTDSCFLPTPTNCTTQPQLPRSRADIASKSTPRPRALRRRRVSGRYSARRGRRGRPSRRCGR